MATIELFHPRTEKPAAGNYYYIRTASGGYNGAVHGKPVDAGCNVLANCVGYANGRFNEIIGEARCRYQLVCNAENFIEAAQQQGLAVGQVPMLGAIMVWRRGATLAGSDGAGHVCVVEEVISSTQVRTSESGYNASAFYMCTRTKGSGNWGQGSAYKFRGFIYNPAVGDTTKLASSAVAALPSFSQKMPAMKKGDIREAVKSLQRILIGCGYDLGKSGADGDFGAKTEAALKAYQKAHGITVDGKFGAEVCSAMFPLV